MIKLDIRKNKELELKIVNLTEEFIQNIITASLKDEDDEAALILTDCENLILELSGLIHALIQDEEHLESMLNQLIFQKIPDDSVLDNIENLEEILSELIQEGVEKYRSGLNENHIEEKIYNEIVEKDTPKEEVLDYQENTCQTNILIDNKEETDKFITQIKNIFPDITVEKNVHYRGIKLQYYIPEMKIALELQENKDTSKKIKGFKDLVAEKEGLKIIKISPDCSVAKLKKLIEP